MEKNYYVYLITNTISGKKYIGSRICYITPEQDNYWGSSKYLNKDYDNFSKDKFIKEILEKNYTNKHDMLDGESNYILKYNTLEPNGYNRFLPNQRIGFHGSCNKGRKNTTEHNKKISNVTSGNKNPMFGRHHSPKTIEKIKEGNRGKNVSNETKEKISNFLKTRKRKPLSKEQKENIRNKTREGMLKYWANKKGN